MTYKELADCLRVAKQIELPYEDYDMVRVFTPKSMDKDLLDLFVQHSTSVGEFSRWVKTYSDSVRQEVASL